MNPLCLELSADLSLPLQCRFKLDHSGGHDWEIEKDVLTDYRAKQLREEQGAADAAELERLVRLGHAIITPSGMLPVRTPGAALRDAEDESEPGVRLESAGAGEANLGRRVIERWPA